ncbi:excinuclease ABC subunit A [Friedmanniella luteola]|uniref:UvrABC system protein A n=1 Tax=Friedmanniella luteola TaxID=546871 RepID=A0A1H1MVP7_9ACTN|nr:excinuclease ABC subunit UvrA [Friedmanniella luteola]SDR90708.1 excinuclease ABC subunit A [Friedmanniella luteola]
MPRDAFIEVRGAREHNLRDVDVRLPREAVVAVTGISGSGKSSLAFGTVFAEAQRRYLESVAPYARRLIQQAGVPRVTSVTGLPPAVALQQQRAAGSSRSSVGTVTTLSNSLRMLFSRAGTYPAGAERLDSDAFSANTAAGACPHCHGVGVTYDVSESSVVPDPSLSIRQGAVAAWPGAWLGKNFRDILATLGHDVDRPWRELDPEARRWILFTDEQPVVTVHAEREAGRIQRPYQGRWTSVRAHVLETFASTRSAPVRRRLRGYLDATPCPVCGGRRLRPEALAVTFAGQDIADLAARPLAELTAVLRAAAAEHEPESTAGTVLADLLGRSELVVDLGLGYLALDRAVPTLSSGELQRLRLATQLRSGLFGVVYVLDEPSAGLHPADTEALWAVLLGLRDAGNTVLLVEHDLELVRGADWLVDVGPGAGGAGGRVLHSGPVAGLQAVPASATRRFLDPAHRPRLRPAPRAPSGWLSLTGVTAHNLRGLDVALPLGAFTVVTGVSGAGKSTLVTQVLAEVVRAHLGLPADVDEEEPAPEDADDAPQEGGPVADAGPGIGWSVGRVDGLAAVRRLVVVDQRPIGRTPRSNLATYTGLFDAVRTVFARTPEARRRRWTASWFSFNVAAGRCPTCKGEGFLVVRMLFLPGTYAPCPTCHGSRYAADTLEVTHRGRTIADVLDLSVDDAVTALDDIPAAVRGLTALRDVGLGYLRLGQPATELSGGEAQRIKLATELQRSRLTGTLYLLDEPTTGLHPSDVERLLRLLHELVDAGSTVVVVEHDAAVALGADWLLDLGPGGGDAGGRLVDAGPPADVVRRRAGPTGTHLARRLTGPA